MEWRRNSEVVRKINVSPAELETLRRFVRRFGQVDNEPDEDQGAAVKIVEPDELAELARRILKAREDRTRHLPLAMFGEPAWEMLLALYAHSAEGKRLSVTQLTSFALSSPTTGLRWLDYLAGEELILRVRHPSDGRSHYIEMSDKARTAMEQYLTEILKSRR